MERCLAVYLWGHLPWVLTCEFCMSRLTSGKGYVQARSLSSSMVRPAFLHLLGGGWCDHSWSPCDIEVIEWSCAARAGEGKIVPSKHGVLGWSRVFLRASVSAHVCLSWLHNSLENSCLWAIQDV